jgi:nucleoside-diphosphate-sugar epimerase
MKKKILVAGGTGFIGYNLLRKLLKHNFELYSLSSKPPKKIIKLKNVKYIVCDISEKKLLSKKIKINFDIVINLSGYVDHSKKIKTLLSHFNGCKNLFNLFKDRNNIKLFIQIGSSLEYGNIKSPQKESSRCHPRSFYGLAKYQATNFLNKQIKKVNFSILILRLYQVYGPHQSENRLIPHVINSCLKNREFDCTEGNQIRDFMHVDDFTNFIIKVLKKKKIDSEIINLGSGKPVKINEIILKIKKMIKSGKPRFGKIEMRKDEILKLYPDIKKLKKLFNWKPKIKINNGLRKTVNFYEKKFIS